MLEWHQYDGVITRRPDKETASFFTKCRTVLSKLTGSYYEKVMEQTKMAAKAMLPEWPQLCGQYESHAAERHLEKLNQVCFCVKNCFINENSQPNDKQMCEVSRNPF